MLNALRRSVLLRLAVMTLFLAFVGVSWGQASKRPVSSEPQRKQLAMGYTLLYQEADGIPKLKWILTFRKKSDEMARVTDDLATFYQELAHRLEQLSKKYPAVRIDAEPMSKIEAETRKAIGADLAKDLAPVIGRQGVEFEREAWLMFYNSLNEQRHLAGVMLGLETEPALKEFLQKTKGQLDAKYGRVGALLDRKYFAH